jgi:hypothetical protein
MGLKQVKPVIAPLFERSPTGGIGADRLIPERMAFLGQDRYDAADSGAAEPDLGEQRPEQRQEDHGDDQQSHRK